MVDLFLPPVSSCIHQCQVPALSHTLTPTRGPKPFLDFSLRDRGADLSNRTGNQCDANFLADVYAIQFAGTCRETHQNLLCWAVSASWRKLAKERVLVGQGRAVECGSQGPCNSCIILWVAEEAGLCATGVRRKISKWSW